MDKTDLRRSLRGAALVVAALATALFASPLPAGAVASGTPGDIIYISGGNIFTAVPGHAAVQATTGGGYDWPKWAPNNSGAYATVAYLYKSNLYVSLLDGSGHLALPGQQVTSGGHVGPPSWDPSGERIAYIQTLQSQLLHIVTFDSEGFGAQGKQSAHRTVVSNTVHKVGPAATPSVTGSWSSLRTSTGVAWSPDGASIAMPGGDCLGIYDECSSVLNIATNVDRTLVGFGGGGDYDTAYATDFAWTADSSHILWNEQIECCDSNTTPISPINVYSYSIATSTTVKIGHDNDAIPAPSPANDGSFLVSAVHNGVDWVTKVTAGGTHTYLYPGYEEDWGDAPQF